MGLLGFHTKPAPLLNQNYTVSPERKSNILSQLTFAWVYPFLKPQPDEDSVRAERSGSVKVAIDGKNETSELGHNKEELEAAATQTLQPMVSRADLPGANVNPKAASIRQAEKTFVPSTNRWTWVLPLFLKKKDISGSMLAEKHEKAAMRSHSIRLFWSCLRTVRRDLLIALSVRLVSRGIILASSVAVKELIRFVSESHAWSKASDDERINLSQPKHIGVGFGLAIGLAAMQQTAFILNGVYGYRSLFAGSLLRIALIDQISRKSMRLSTRARVKQTAGRLTSAVSGDATFMDTGSTSMVDVIVEPIAITVGCALLIYNLGYSALVGVGVLFASSPILTAMMNQLIGSRQEQMKFIDKRLRLLSEIFKSIRQIKLYAYEAFFGERIIQVREKELGRLKVIVWNRSMVIATMTFLPTLAAVLTFITYGLSGHNLEPAVIFSAFQLFNIIQTPLQNLPASFANLTDAWVALTRLSDIFLAEEYSGSGHIESNPHSDAAVTVHGDFTFESSEPSSNSSQNETAGRDRKAEKEEKKRKAVAERVAKAQEKQSLPLVAEEELEDVASIRPPFMLRNINLSIPRGAFVCVIGRIGSGKSALMAALIGEMRQIKGNLELGGTLSYTAQQSWIQNATLRENITFTNDNLDEERLANAITSCALSRDIEQLQDGLDTEIGERGINLSGGQKARIALARAVYHDADIVLLDSPLAAVDSHVSAHLVEKCILGQGALGNKTRILVTHHLEVLPDADMILVMEEGRIAQQGTYKELMSRPGLLQSLMAEHGNNQADHGKTGSEETAIAEKEDSRTFKDKPQDATSNTKLIMDEERNTGSISWRIYMAYARVMSKEWWFITSILMLIFGQASSVLNTLFLGFWSGQSISGFRQGDYMALYAAFGAASALCAFASSYAMFMAGVRASFIMFDSALTSVLRSPISFHDATPVGRIIHRLTKDVEKLDDRLTYQWYSVLVNLAAVVGTIFLVFYTYPLLGILFLPLTLIYMAVGKFFNRSSREIKRLDSLQRSFVYSSFGEQLGGLSTIRAFGMQDHFLKRLQEKADRQMRSEYLIVTARRWLVLRLDSLGTLLILGIGLFGVGLRNQVDPIKLGVVLTYSIRTVQVFGLMVHYAVQVEQEMNTAERVLHYIDLEHEAAPSLGCDPPSNWPQNGHVIFDNVQMRYRPDLPLVLKGLTFQAQPGEKVGIVGRTGAGKSSLAQALFRIVELAEGSIKIDGYDLRNIGLDTLRSQLSALPQDTLLFSGTMRENLDPTGIKSDHELNDILHRCGLVPTAAQIQAGSDVERYKKFQLDAIISDDGENFSGGERQLVALCRALVKNSHVLLLDEATSSVDPETDAIIQDCIRKEFSSTTLLCIAHRLATIAFYDKVLVMDAGRIAEFAHPLELFDRPNSIFRSMCDAAKLTREAIIRIRAGENARNVEGEMEAGMQPESGAMEKIPDEPYTLGETARKADQADEIVAVIPTEDHATDKQKD
ncbi:multidrug resistance-associated ABC transporter [Filobasidium floriforme]|uniref:multidrug resistance-associated ABC transporter n=1 Tax=Filobasidium floriforme TaxID=5210 RepID=UPI001E8EE81D|nr:multidrug resistance-associated ABC transporter [Filobasidium floriforme]KAH8086808.1 multidrug resistance-associated ABC transporter [Filobasidium floriforme]